MKRIYLDHNAGSPMREGVRDTMVALLDAGIANASSVHTEGRHARAQIAGARAAVANLVGTKPDNVIFTSSASEAANLALTPNYLHGKDQIKFAKCFISAIEHPCVLAGGRFDKDDIELLPVDGEGIIDLPALKTAMSAYKDSDEQPYVAVMMANNETGVIQPISKIAEMVHEVGGFLLVDAVQAAGKMIIDISSLGADALLLSAHKIGGPQGIGAMVMNSNAYKPENLIKGGGQENHRRAGTENVSAIAGFGKAAEIALDEFADFNKRIVELRDCLEKDLVASVGNNGADLSVFAQNSPRLGNTSCFALKGINAETALIGFDLSGIAISSGSACSSGKVKTSHVLQAMGVNDEIAQCALRVSLGWDTKKEDVEGFIKGWNAQVNRLYDAA